MRPPALNILSRRVGLTGLSARAALGAKPGGWKPRLGPMSAPTAVARPRSPAGTIMHHFQAAADPPGSGLLILMATHSNGISAVQLQRQLAFGSYKTAWLLCAKTPPKHARPGPQPARRPRRGRMKPKSLAAAKTIRHRRWRAQPSRQNAGRRRRRGRGRRPRPRPHPPGPSRVITRDPPASMPSSPPISPPALPPRTDGWSGYPGAAGVTHDPMSSARWPLTSS